MERNTDLEGSLDNTEVEFPEYCRMDGRAMALVQIATLHGMRNSRSGCQGCADYSCFGNNNGYERELTENQRKAIARWRDYINGRIAQEQRG